MVFIRLREIEMHYSIQEGVDLDVINTKKFKNSIIVINFTAPLNSENFAYKSLLAEMLENSSQKYNSELKISRELSKMFGANYGVSVFKYGNQHVLQIKISFPNDAFIPGKTELFHQIILFLKEVIEKPLVEDAHFQNDFFKLHQKNMINYVNSIIENKEYYSKIKLQSLFYDHDDPQGQYILGTSSQLASVDANSLYEFYRQMISQEQVNILVAGNFNSEIILDEIKNFDFITQRQVQKYPIPSIPNDKTEVSRLEEEFVGSQSVINLGYYLPVYYGDANYFAATIFNQLFGGTGQSMLFTNVREKSGLAYDIHSGYSSLTGMINVQAGVELSKVDQAIQEIEDQLRLIQIGQFDIKLIDNIKNAMVNHHFAENDYLRTIVDREYIQSVLKISWNDEEWIEGINRVSKEDVVKVANQMKLRAIYLCKEK